jgi:phage terminase large subunit-like protein
MDFRPSAAVASLAALPEPERIEAVRRLSWPAARELLARWSEWAHEGQRPPRGEDWRVWLLMAGRGFGKTRAGSEYVSACARADGRLRIALAGATMDDVRKVMVEGESGLLAVAREGEALRWTPHLGELVFPSGAIAFAYSGANPERLRGPEHHLAWCDELAKWAYAEASWTNLMLGLRLGERPRVLVTTTPRPIPLLRRLIEEAATRLSRGRTRDNLNLPPAFVASVTDLYGGTRLGRQELDGELIEEVEGSLWPRALIEACRVRSPLPAREGQGVGASRRRVLVAEASDPASSRADRYPPPSPPFEGGGPLKRVVVGVDPPASTGGDACGIVVCALGEDGCGYVLADASVAGFRPEGWAAAVAHAAATWGADRVVAEGNQGGQMVESVLMSVESRLPVRIVHARRGKSARAEPVASLFERGRAKFAGAFPELEDQLAGMTIAGGYEGPGRSPDRADAMVWALTELMLGPVRGEPRVRRL